jgi:hypothetical protein
MFCNFAVRITTADPFLNQYTFDIIDDAFFSTNTKYFTAENTEVEMCFIRNNKIYDIHMTGQYHRVFLKRRLMTLDYCSGFLATLKTFSIAKCVSDSTSPSDAILSDNDNARSLDKLQTDCGLEVGDVVFIQTNLLSKNKRNQKTVSLIA